MRKMRNATPVRKVVRTIICASIGIIALCLLYSYIYNRWEPVKVVYTVEHIKHVEKAQIGNENEHPVVVLSSDGERGVANVSKGPGDHYAINRSGDGIHVNEAEKSTIEAADGKHDQSRKLSDIKGTETTTQSSESLPRVLPRTFLPPSVLSTNSSRNDHLPPLRAPPVSVVENKTSVFNLETSKDDISDCDIQNSWHGTEHNISSTYDILNSLDYKTDTNGAYPIPVKKFEDITKNIENRSDILNVFLVPFSHADPGYGLTFEQYYSQKTSRTLNLMVQKLLQYPNMTFQWAETVFLARWFRDINDETKENVRALIKCGQLEIVLGGWVMPDEASTHYIAVVDQLIEGHQWLEEQLGIKPTTAWVNDPFGYSTTMPYLWKLSGIDNLLILRINQNLKAKLMSKKSLEFLWRPYWKHLRNDSDVLTSLMPFTNYWIDDVCGPNQNICSIFNYLHIGEKGRNAVQVTEENVHILAELLYRQLRVTGELYQFNNLYIGLGEDFSYTRAQEWDNTYLNFEKILTYINNKSEWNMRIKFGTLSEYFANIRQQAKLLTSIGETTRNAASTFPVLSGDFFPYTERNQEFWTGYYTTRPLLKKFSRDIETLIRGADIFNVMAHSMFKHYWVRYAAMTAVAAELTAARRDLAMFMHHDGITGTSLPHVVRDFETRLFNSYAHAHSAMKTILISLLSRGKEHDSKLLLEDQIKPGKRSIMQKRIIDSTQEIKIVFANTISKRRYEIVDIIVTSANCAVFSARNAVVSSQITRVASPEKKELFSVSFAVDIPAFGIEVYTLKPTQQENNIMSYLPVTSEEHPLKISNDHIACVFNASTGMLQSVTVNNVETKMEAQYKIYQSDHGGAYIFGPKGEANRFKTEKLEILRVHGNLWSEVIIRSNGFVERYRLFNIEGIQGLGVHISTEVDIAAVGANNVDVIYRFNTDVNNDINFYTDQNGYQLMGRKTNSSHRIESNYYPMVTRMVIEDSNTRLTLHSKQAHGVSSLTSGQFEVMLDRHTFRDDGRGLGQGVYDNVRVNSDFVLQLEHKKSKTQTQEERYAFSTKEAVLLNEFLQNTLQIYSLVDARISLVNKIHPMKDSTFPCDTSIVGFRNIFNEDLQYKFTSLVLHRKSFQCGFQENEKFILKMCKASKSSKLSIKSVFPKLKVKLYESSLSMLHDKGQLSADTDISPQKNELRSFKIVI